MAEMTFVALRERKDQMISRRLDMMEIDFRSFSSRFRTKNSFREFIVFHLKGIPKGRTSNNRKRTTLEALALFERRVT